LQLSFVGLQLPLEMDIRMTCRFPQLFFCLAAGIATIFAGLPMTAQSLDSTSKAEVVGQPSGTSMVAARVAADAPMSVEPLPENPGPQQAPPSAGQAPAAPAPATNAPAASSSQATGQTGQPATGTPTETPADKKQHDIAEEQIKQEKTQRIGILPNFNASYIDNAVPLTAGQKFRLMFYTEKDPATFGFSMFIALIGQAEGSHPAYGGGIGGYGKRFGQNYADTFDGAFWGNAVLPSLWHQDPRYFRLGTGTIRKRIFYALSTNVRAKHDGSGKWEPNYSNLVGNVISGGISNLYLPADERGLGSTFEGAAVVTAEGGIGSMLEEFWPDVTAAIKRHRDKKNHPVDVDKIAPALPAANKPGTPAPQQLATPQ
jgi:hypothetical protein